MRSTTHERLRVCRGKSRQLDFLFEGNVFIEGNQCVGGRITIANRTSTPISRVTETQLSSGERAILIEAQPV